MGKRIQTFPSQINYTHFRRLFADRLSSHAILVFIYLSLRANVERQCWPSIKTICKDIKLSPSTVSRALKQLEETGWLIKESQERVNGSRTSNLYTLRDPSV